MCKKHNFQEEKQFVIVKTSLRSKIKFKLSQSEFSKLSKKILNKPNLPSMANHLFI